MNHPGRKGDKLRSVKMKVKGEGLEEERSG